MLRFPECLRCRIYNHTVWSWINVSFGAAEVLHLAWMVTTFMTLGPSSYDDRPSYQNELDRPTYNLRRVESRSPRHGDAFTWVSIPMRANLTRNHGDPDLTGRGKSVVDIRLVRAGSVLRQSSDVCDKHWECFWQRFCYQTSPRLMCTLKKSW